MGSWISNLLGPPVLMPEDFSGNNDYLFKISMVGDPQVGKSVLLRNCDNNYLNEASYVPTTGVDYKILDTVSFDDGKTARIQLWELGSSASDEVKEGYIRCHGGFIFVYNVANLESFENIGTKWIPLVSNNSANNRKMILLGTKLTEIDQNRVVDSNTAQRFAQDHGMLFAEVNGLNRAEFLQALKRLALICGKFDGSIL